MKTFKVQDLMISVVPSRVGAGGVGMPGPDATLDDFPPTITPVISVAKYSPRFRLFDQFEGRIELLNSELLNEIALDVGKMAIAGAIKGTAYCTIDMPTCARNQWLSPVASLAESLRFEDYIEAQVIMDTASELISEVAHKRLNEAREHAGDLIPKFEELRGG